MITCVYCGGSHERPADVRECWTTRQGGDPEARPEPSAPDQPASLRRSPPERPADSAISAPDHPAARVATAEPVAALLRRGPAHLGRHVLVGPDGAPPEPWGGCDRVVVDEAALTSPQPLIDDLQTAADEGRGLVIALALPFDDVTPGVDDRAPYEIGVDHEVSAGFLLERLHHLIWSNAIDCRAPGRPHWTLVDAAVAAGCTVGGAGDVVAPDGTELWLDGGPLRHRGPDGDVAVVHRVAIEHGSLAPPRANTTGAELAPDQVAAVTHEGGSARIIAPAGSGKTRVLTERARQLVQQWGVPASAACLVAFNKRAQEEMRARTAGLPGLQVRTLNSIALAIINGTPPFAPQPGRWRTIDEPEVRRVLQRFVTTKKLLNRDPIAPWIEALGLVRLGLVDPVETELRYGGDVDGLAEVLPHYLAALRNDRAVDFDGQIDRALRVLLTDTDARLAAQRACRVLLVDEFQDLTPAHLLLVRLLAGPAGAVFGVGDDDQTIYGYNGADPGWLIDFARWFPGAGDHPLEVNYRCPAGVVESVDRLLRHNRRRVGKTIRAASGDAAGWRVAGSDDPESADDTVGATVDAVAAELEAGGAPADIAVLTRVNAVLAPVQVALTARGIAVSGGVGTEFVDRTAVRAALAWLRLGAGTRFLPDDLGEAVRRPSRSLHPRISEWVSEQRDVDALLRLADRITNERDATRIREFAGDIARLQALANGAATTRRLVDALVDDIGLGGAVATLDNTRHGMNRGSQNDDLLAVRQLADLQPDPSKFEWWLDEMLSTRREPGGVTLATVHRVKGQEWPVVVVHQAAADQYPHRLADDVEEERRIFHVAVTRASRSVTIVPGESPSAFVAELTAEPPDLPDAPPEPVRRSAGAPKRRSDEPAHPLLDKQQVFAVEGLVLVDQGQEWTVVELAPTAAVARLGHADSAPTRDFALGAKVETLGRQRGTLSPRPGEVEPASAVAFDALRQFRDRARNGKPAYTVFDDKTLAAIASAQPLSLDELARVRGVGPAKLEQYGEQVVRLVVDAVDASGGSTR